MYKLLIASQLCSIGDLQTGTLTIFFLMMDNNLAHCSSGLKVNDQLVAYTTRFSAVRLKNHVWSHHRALKAKVQCDFSSAYSPHHSNFLRLINIISIRYNTTRHKIRKSHHFSFIGVCSIRHAHANERMKHVLLAQSTITSRKECMSRARLFFSFSVHFL